MGRRPSVIKNDTLSLGFYPNKFERIVNARSLLLHNGETNKARGIGHPFDRDITRFNELKRDLNGIAREIKENDREVLTGPSQTRQAMTKKIDLANNLNEKRREAASIIKRQRVIEHEWPMGITGVEMVTDDASSEIYGTRNQQLRASSLVWARFKEARCKSK